MARVGGWRSCHWRRLWRDLSRRPRAILSILVCTHSAQSVQARQSGRRVGEDTGGPICLSRQGAWLDRCPGVGRIGPKGLWASAMPLFLYKGPLTCTSPECVWEQVICRPQAPCRADAVLPPSWPWWQLALWDGGGLGFACVMGTALSSGSVCTRARHGHSRPLHTWVSMAPLEIPQLRSDSEEMESGWG